MIVLHLSRLEKQPEELEGEEPAAFLEVQDSEWMKITSGVRYKLRAELVSGEILVRGVIAVAIAGECARCLEPVEKDVQNESFALAIEAGIEEDIDITEDIRAEMLLALPMLLLCKEDCRGLCSQCGANLNRKKCRCKKIEAPTPVSDAWSALDQLKNLD